MREAVGFWIVAAGVHRQPKATRRLHRTFLSTHARLKPDESLSSISRDPLMGRRFGLTSRCHATSCAFAIALAVVLSIGLFPLASAPAARLGGAYYVDDADIEKA